MNIHKPAQVWKMFKFLNIHGASQYDCCLKFIKMSLQEMIEQLLTVTLQNCTKILSAPYLICVT